MSSASTDGAQTFGVKINLRSMTDVNSTKIEEGDRMYGSWLETNRTREYQQLEYLLLQE
jgi:hypothetical protein